MLFFYVDIFAQIQLSISINSCEQLNRKFFACCLHDRPGGEPGKNRQSWKNFVKNSLLCHLHVHLKRLRGV